MATFSFDNASNANGSGTITWSHTNTAGDILVVTCGVPSSDAITGAKYNGVAMTLVDKNGAISGGQDRWCYLFYLLSPATGSHTVEVTGAGSDATWATAASYIGAKQSGQPDAHNKGDNDGTAINCTGTVTTTQTNCLVIMSMRIENDTPGTISSSPVGAVTRGAADNRGQLYELLNVQGVCSITNSTNSSMDYVMASFLSTSSGAISVNNSGFLQFM